ncbi:MAG: hypothetical protein JXA67_20825 [Micromonosporaceae bacterium]|nr:hypothetical protein [Micromonosporaceae bacterium]
MDINVDADVDVTAEMPDASGDAVIPAPRLSAKSLTSRAKVERVAARMPKATAA